MRRTRSECTVVTECRGPETFADAPASSSAPATPGGASTSTVVDRSMRSATDRATPDPAPSLGSAATTRPPREVTTNSGAISTRVELPGTVAADGLGTLQHSDFR